MINICLSTVSWYASFWINPWRESIASLLHNNAFGISETKHVLLSLNLSLLSSVLVGLRQVLPRSLLKRFKSPKKWPEKCCWGYRRKEIWRWNNRVNEAVKEKRRCCKVFTGLQRQTLYDQAYVFAKAEYDSAKKLAKRIVSHSKRDNVRPRLLTYIHRVQRFTT